MSTSSHAEDARSTPGTHDRASDDRVVDIDMQINDDQRGGASDAAQDDAGTPDEAALGASIEALLLSTDRPLSEAHLAELLDMPGKGAAKRLRDTIDRLNAAYQDGGRAFRLERLAGGWQVMTLPEHGALLAKLHGERPNTRLSQAALETLAIIAYRQPIMRAEIEAIRGVACGEVLRGLLDRRLVRIAGRAEELGRPMLYGTTSEFLKVFGLAGLDDLPPVQGMESDARRRATPRADARQARHSTASTASTANPDANPTPETPEATDAGAADNAADQRGDGGRHGPQAD